MKKHLLGTSAIVAASLGMASTAMGQGAPAPQPVTITINGYVGQYVGWSDQDNVGSSNIGTIPQDPTCINCARLDDFDMLSDVRLIFNGRGNLGDGLTVGVQVEINGVQSGSANYQHSRAANAYLDSTWGRLTIGTQTMMARSMVGSSYATGNPWGFGAELDVFGRSGMVDGGQMHGLLINPTGSSGTNNTFNGVGGDMVGDSYTNKVQYLTPRVFGFQIGLGWAPENSKDVTGTGEVVSLDGNKATHRNGVSAAVNYVGNFFGVDVAAGAGYITWLDAPNKTIAGLTAGSFINDGDPRHEVPNPEQWIAGAAVHYAGFKIGAGWGKISDARGLQTNLTEFTGIQQFRASPLNSSLVNLEGEAFSISASYSFGPASVSVNYTDANANDCPIITAGATTCSGVDKFTALGVSGKYLLGPGVWLTAGGFYGKYRGNNYNNGLFVDPAAPSSTTSVTNASQNNEGGGVIGGILVRF
jgi:outer membrane protein OmpU